MSQGNLLLRSVSFGLYLVSHSCTLRSAASKLKWRTEQGRALTGHRRPQFMLDADRLIMEGKKLIKEEMTSILYLYDVNLTWPLNICQLLFNESVASASLLGMWYRTFGKRAPCDRQSLQLRPHYTQDQPSADSQGVCVCVFWHSEKACHRSYVVLLIN